MEEFMLNMKAILCDATTLAPNNLPQDEELGVLFMVLQMVFSENVCDYLMEIYRKLRPTLHLKKSRQEWHDALFYASTSAKHFKRQDFVNVTNQTRKEGGITMSTSLLDELIAERETLAAERETLVAKCETNEARGEAKMIIHILTRRLKTPSKSLQKKIYSIQNTAKLEELADFALTCVSLDEFATALR
jgi:hypothetical protein